MKPEPEIAMALALEKAVRSLNEILKIAKAPPQTRINVVLRELKVAESTYGAIFRLHCRPRTFMPHSNFSQTQVNHFKIEAIKSTLRQSSLFAKLDEPALEAVADACATKQLAKGETLFHEGATSQGFYLVQSGAICLSRLSREGKEQVISVFEPVTCFAEATLGVLEAYPANAVAIESSQVILIRKDRFRSIIKENPDLALTMLASMSIHLKHLVQMIDDLKFKQIECRLAHWLNRNANFSSDRTSGTIELPMSKKLLASQLGVTSETLSRAFARFRNENIITVDGRHISIVDVKALSAYLDE